MRGRAGFSLIELLTVIGIIAIMAAILAPVYVSAKQKASQSQCQSNLRQTGKAFDMYLNDNSQCYPCVTNLPSKDSSNNAEGQCLWMGRYWRWPLKRYVGYSAAFNTSDPLGARQTTHVWSSILHCPADPTPCSTYDATSYAYSAAFYHTPAQVNAMRLVQLYSDPNPVFSVIQSSNVVYPTKKALVSEWLSAHSKVQTDWWHWGGSRNYLFVDGHVTYLESHSIHAAGDSYPDINLTVNGVAGRDVE